MKAKLFHGRCARNDVCSTFYLLNSIYVSLHKFGPSRYQAHTLLRVIQLKAEEVCARASKSKFICA